MALLEPLLPTGALPLTSVATVVTVGREPRAEVRHHDGHTASVELDGVAALVSEQGNPGNACGVDRVCVTAPTPWLSTGAEVVDTPGTGSLHEANTDGKADLVESEVVAQVVDFTGDVVQQRLGTPVPVFALPALFGRSCTRLDYLDALHRGLAAVCDDDDRSSPDVGSTLGMLERKFRAVDEGLALLKPEQDEDMQIADL